MSVTIKRREKTNLKQWYLNSFKNGKNSFFFFFNIIANRNKHPDKKNWKKETS